MVEEIDRILRQHDRENVGDLEAEDATTQLRVLAWDLHSQGKLKRRLHSLPEEQPAYVHDLFQFIPGDGVIVVEGQRIPLTMTEARILRTLCTNPNHVFSRQQLLGSLMSSGDVSLDIDLRTINVHMTHLREKLDAGRDLEESPIETARGFGYMLVDHTIPNAISNGLQSKPPGQL